MNPPMPLRVETVAVQWDAAEVCLNEASDVPVCMSCKDIVPGPGVDEDGPVAQRMHSWTCMALSAVCSQTVLVRPRTRSSPDPEVEKHSRRT